MNRLIVVLLLAAGVCPCPLSVAGDCRVHRVAVAPIVQQVVYPSVNYFVGQPIRVQAIVKKEMQSDPDWAEFQEFKRWKALKSNPQAVTEPAKPKGILQTTCAKCHSGATPAGAFAFDGTHAITPEKFQKIVTWASGKVKPPGEKMPGVMAKLIADKQTAQLLSELIDLQAKKDDE